MKAREIDTLTFIDIETTGLNEETDSIIEIAAATVRIRPTFEIISTDTTLIAPPEGGWSINFEPERYEGVDWSSGEDLKSSLEYFAEAYFKDATFAGQNPHFDLRFLRRDFKRLELSWPEHDYHIIDLCSPSLFLVLHADIPGVSLKHTREWAGCPEGGHKHRAASDVADAIQVFFCLSETFRQGLQWLKNEVHDISAPVEGAPAMCSYCGLYEAEEGSQDGYCEGCQGMISPPQEPSLESLEADA